MEEKLKKQAIDLFVAQYGVTPQDKGVPVIDIGSKQDTFLFGVDENALSAYKKADALNAFARKTLWLSPLLALLMYAAGAGICVFPQYKWQLFAVIGVFFCALLGWGGVLFSFRRKFLDARKISKDKVIEIGCRIF